MVFIMKPYDYRRWFNSRFISMANSYYNVRWPFYTIVTDKRKKRHGHLVFKRHGHRRLKWKWFRGR